MEDYERDMDQYRDDDVDNLRDFEMDMKLERELDRALERSLERDLARAEGQRGGFGGIGEFFSLLFGSRRYEAIMKKEPKDRLSVSSRKEKKQMAQNSKTSSATLIEIAKQNDHTLNMMLLRNQNTPIEALEVLANSHNPIIREKVIHHPRVSLSLLNQLINDEDEAVQRLAREKLMSRGLQEVMMNPMALQMIDESCRSEKLYLAAVKKEPWIFQDIPETSITENICSEVMKSQPLVVCFFPEQFQTVDYALAGLKKEKILFEEKGDIWNLKTSYIMGCLAKDLKEPVIEAWKEWEGKCLETKVKSAKEVLEAKEINGRQAQSVADKERVADKLEK